MDSFQIGLRFELMCAPTVSRALRQLKAMVVSPPETQLSEEREVVGSHERVRHSRPREDNSLCTSH